MSDGWFATGTLITCAISLGLWFGGLRVSSRIVRRHHDALAVYLADPARGRELRLLEDIPTALGATCVPGTSDLLPANALVPASAVEIDWMTTKYISWRYTNCWSGTDQSGRYDSRSRRSVYAATAICNAVNTNQ